MLFPILDIEKWRPTSKRVTNGCRLSVRNCVSGMSSLAKTQRTVLARRKLSIAFAGKLRPAIKGAAEHSLDG